MKKIIFIAGAKRAYPRNSNAIKMLEKNFEVIEKDDKIDGVDVNIFGYMSLHYKAKLKDVSSDSYYKNIKDIPFEIQITTFEWNESNELLHDEYHREKYPIIDHSD